MNVNSTKLLWLLMALSISSGQIEASPRTFSSTIVLSQSEASGQIKDEKGAGVSGATVVNLTSGSRTQTDQSGNFKLAAKVGDSLSITFVGYQDQRITISSLSNIQIELTPENELLDEVVVVGYGTQKKANLTGAVDQVGSEVFEGRMAPNATQMLAGAVPNLNLNIADGKPTRSASYNIRGTTSIGQGGSALVLIDGVEGDPRTLNPNDIENVSVLKDASSAAIYGSRGTFGVVLITTKRAKQGTTSINYSSNYASQAPTTLPDFVTDGYTYASHFFQAYNSWNNYSSIPSKMNKTQIFSPDWLEEFKRRKDAGINEPVTVNDNGEYVYYASEDYYGTLLKDNVFTMEQNLSVSGRSDKVDYYLSGRYYDYGGLYRFNTDDFNSVNLRGNGGVQVTDWLRVYNNVDYSSIRYHNPITVGEGGNIWRNIADEGHPTSSIFNPDGSLSFSAAYSIGDYIYGKNGSDTDEKNIRNTTGFETKFFNNKFRVKGDLTFRNKDLLTQRKRVPIPYSVKEGEIVQLATKYNDLYEASQRDRYLITNIYGEYEDTFAEKHYFKGLVGYNYEQKTYNSVYTTKNGLLNPDVDNINLALGETVTATGGYHKYRLAGVFFRLNYVFNDKYLLEVNGRYDGSSKFPVNQQWAFFPSVSAGWRVSQESFWNVSPDVISDFKIRGSYGSLGNGNISPYSFMDLYDLATMDHLINGEKYRYTKVPKVIPNNLTWETATTTNIGADISFLNGKLNLVGDYYVRQTTDMFTRSKTLPDIFGADSPLGNYSDMTTKGFEITLSYKNHFQAGGKPFSYNLKATLADYKSTIDRYNSNGLLSDHYVGKVLGEIWGYKTLGLFQSQEEIDGAPDQKLIKSSSSGQVYPGDLRFADLDGNGIIDYGANTLESHGDKMIIGNADPRYIYSFNLGADWNNIFFSAFFQGVGKQQWYPHGETIFWGQFNRPYNNMPSWHLDNYWTEENRDAYFPRYAGYNASVKGNAQTRFLQNVAYVRLKNLQVGYSLPLAVVEKMHLKSLRVSASAENLWTWSPLYKKTKDIDVANIGSSDPDISSSNSGDGFNYPTMRSFSLGLSLTF